MGNILWARGTYRQDRDGLWYRPGIDKVTGSRHLLVSQQRAGLDSNEQYLHIHFWQTEPGSEKLGFNVAYFDSKSIQNLVADSTSASHIKTHVYEKNTPYGGEESIFHTPEMYSKILAHINNDAWFHSIEPQPSPASTTNGDATSSSQFGTVAVFGIGRRTFQSSLRYGKPFRADTDELHAVARELVNLKKQLEQHTYEMDELITRDARVLGNLPQDLSIREHQIRWHNERENLLFFLSTLQTISEYVERKAEETDQLF